MRMVLSIKESRHGLWRICSGEAVLYDKLRFTHAIRLARGLAREEHANSGRTVSVEMACAEFTITLAHYAGTASSQRVAA
ncbi:MULTISPECIES: hypothetical protein [Rhodanobacter]|uniref:hypothetical protein n=1 Tax=Rhodanobacter TaxID=75309 RepID=UPI0004017919|nr:MULTISPECIES: hypothetical protein [Rhodanobacter]KZC19340.1 hypothetical protein RHOFW104R3_31725 [Rhodanobacter denitrificans]UJJ51591.1 hypothetical protein LRK52_02550 [Rhodanobacter denitrificans]UJM94336.1 hypothetical protein LRK32_02550 [Rhodanobacter denitrificans]UJM97865.1 hypothetical protein LRK44_02550 [Rhodanobacter denitrificans]UJN22720.1 hypothetical protein LRK54_05940 [Rhodanobacter denitrificans]